MPARNITSCIAVFLYLAVGSLLSTRIALPAPRQRVPQKRAAIMSETEQPLRVRSGQASLCWSPRPRDGHVALTLGCLQGMR